MKENFYSLTDAFPSLIEKLTCFLRGLVAEWLRRGLQILVSRFDSGRGLQMTLT